MSPDKCLAGLTDNGLASSDWYVFIIYSCNEIDTHIFWLHHTVVINWHGSHTQDLYLCDDLKVQLLHDSHAHSENTILQSDFTCRSLSYSRY